MWATGCTLYRLLVGSYPFDDAGAAARGAFESPHRINLQIPMSLTRVVETALQVDPAARYADAMSMLARPEQMPRLVLLEPRGPA